MLWALTGVKRALLKSFRELFEMVRIVAFFLAGLSAPILVSAQDNSDTAEGRLGMAIHTNFLIPYQLVVDAGIQAAKRFSEPGDQWQFIDNYSKGAKEALIWSPHEAKAYAESLKLCNEGKQAELHIVACGHVEGYEAVTKRAIPVTLHDFGYISLTAFAEVVREQRSGRIYAQVRDSPPWLLGSTPAVEGLKAGSCYSLRGHLSAEGGFGGRFLEFSREFLVIEAKQSPRPCVDPQVLARSRGE